MQLYIDYTILDISLWITFHINIFELLDSDIADKIIYYCCENLDKIIADNDDGRIY